MLIENINALLGNKIRTRQNTVMEINRLGTKPTNILTILVATVLIILPLTIIIVNNGLHIRIVKTVELVGPDEKIIEHLLQGEADSLIIDKITQDGRHVDLIRDMGHSILHSAAGKKRHKLAQWLLEHGANPNGIATGSSPLSAAILRSDHIMIDLLLKYGANPDYDMSFGITPRNHAESSNDVWIRERFARKGADKGEGDK